MAKKKPASLERLFIDLTLAVAIVYLGYDVVREGVASSTADARLKLVLREAHALYDAFDAYHKRNRSYPGETGPTAFDLETLDPLGRRGYYRGDLTPLLLRGRVDAYGSPDDLGPDREFWLELTLADDPGVRVLVARSDDAPLGRGRWRDGVFLYRNGALERP